MRRAEVILKYTRSEIGVLLHHRDKHAGDLHEAYWMEYPSIAHALEAVADDLRDGLVEKITADGKALAREEIEALTD